MTDDDLQATGLAMPICDVEKVVEAFSDAGIELVVDRIKDRSAFSVDFKAYPMGGAQLVRTKWATDAWLRANLTDRITVMLNPSGSTPSVFTMSGDSVAASTRTAPIAQPERKINVFRPADGYSGERERSFRGS